jgi:hypothetical protein
MDWRADQLRRSTSGAAVNEPVLVFSLTTTSSRRADEASETAGDDSKTVTFSAGQQEAEALLRSVTEALNAADRLVDT